MLSIEYLQQCNNNLIDHCDTNIPGLGEQNNYVCDNFFTVDLTHRLNQHADSAVTSGQVQF